MALQICPKCKKLSCMWYIDNNSPLTQWGCKCGWHAFEYENRMRDCIVCGNKKADSYMVESGIMYWWCYRCGRIELIDTNPFANLDFEKGIVRHIETDFSQESLREDLLQVIYPQDYLLDVGWFGTNFTVSIIKNEDWENPVTKEDANILDLRKVVVCAIEKIENMITE